MNISGVTTTAMTFARQNSPAILTAAAVGGLVATIVFAAKASPQAADLIYSKSQGHPEVATPWEKVKMTWKVWIPTVSMAAVTAVCIIGANFVHTRRAAAMAATLGMVERTATIYQEKVKDLLDEKSRTKVETAVAQEYINQTPLSKSTVYVTERGEALTFDTLSGRYFKSDPEAIRKAVNDFNHDLINGFGVWRTVNDWYDALGLEHVAMGDSLGWTPERLVRVDLHPALAEDDKPCISLLYANAPAPFAPAF